MIKNNDGNHKKCKKYQKSFTLEGDNFTEVTDSLLQECSCKTSSSLQIETTTTTNEIGKKDDIINIITSETNYEKLSLISNKFNEFHYNKPQRKLILSRDDKKFLKTLKSQNHDNNFFCECINYNHDQENEVGECKQNNDILLNGKEFLNIIKKKIHLIILNIFDKNILCKKIWNGPIVNNNNKSKRIGRNNSCSLIHDNPKNDHSVIDNYFVNNSLNHMMECPMKNLKYFTLSIGNQSNIISGCHILDNVYTRYTIIYSQSEDTDMNYHLWGNPNILRLAEFLKVNFVIYDYSGYGNSIGHLTVETLKENLKRIIKYIHQEYEVPKNKIILWGSSFGGTLSAEVSKEENNLCGLILFNAPNSMLEYLCYINNKMNYIEYKKQKRYSNDFNTCEALSKVKIPTLVVINHNKTNVPHSTSFRIYKSALNPVSPYTVHNNNNINLLQNKDALRRVKEFLIYDI